MMTRGFSLIEVVAAVAIFSVSVVALVGQLGPLGQSIEAARDEVVVAHLGAAVRARLGAMPFDQSAHLIHDQNDPIPSIENADYSRLLFATRTGTIGVYDEVHGDWR